MRRNGNRTEVEKKRKERKKREKKGQKWKGEEKIVNYKIAL